MSDFLLELSDDQLAADLAFDGNDFESEDGLRNAVFLSLFLDAEAPEEDPLPAGETDRRGFWADAVPVVDGDKTGSRLWLLERSKNEPGFLPKAQSIATDALQWFVDDKVASSVSVVAAFFDDERGYSLVVELTRPARGIVKFQFDRLWDVEEAR